MELYKKSRYNILVPYNNEIIVFNGFSGAIGKFDIDTFERFNNDKLTKQETEILIKKGILIPTDFDEIEVINADRITGICNDKIKNFRIWATSACNARCYYCFENDIQSINMNVETADALVNYIGNSLKKDDALKIVWFGGEPLLNTYIINYITEKLLKICSEKNIRYRANIISNGSLVTKEIACRMSNDWKITSAQITLDGYNECYDKIKNYYNPKRYNFFSVIENIKILAQNNISVAIRMNYDTSNFDSLKSLIEYLHVELKNYKNIDYYIYPVWDALNENNFNAFHTETEADNNLIKLFDMLVDYGMASVVNVARLKYRKHQCKSCNKNYCAFLADGKIVKCSETFNQVLGDVWHGVIDKEHYDFWISGALDEKCKKCVYLPLCQGGCRSSYFTKMPQCFAYKPIIDDILRWYVSKLERKE